jgi:hypothetical protein
MRKSEGAMANTVNIRIVNGDALAVKSDALVLKYAQANYGVDRAAMQILANAGWDTSGMCPKPGDYRLVRDPPNIGPHFLIFMGVEPLYQFSYGQIRDFARHCLGVLAAEAPEVKTLSVTLHGVKYGLDEAEAFESELAGFWDAISSQEYPPALRQILIVERDVRRSKRLQPILESLLSSIMSAYKHPQIESEEVERLRAAGYASDSKPRAFVAMPFREDMDDVYHYGIQEAVKKAGFLCERADLSAFTGDVMQWVRDRIRSATLVVADLTGANPNVYLEVGYAWGCEKPTVLLAKDRPPSEFDARGQRCLVYKRIQDLEISLSGELSNLRRNGYLR